MEGRSGKGRESKITTINSYEVKEVVESHNCPCSEGIEHLKDDQDPTVAACTGNDRWQ